MSSDFELGAQMQMSLVKYTRQLQTNIVTCRKFARNILQMVHLISRLLFLYHNYEMWKGRSIKKISESIYLLKLCVAKGSYGNGHCHGKYQHSTNIIILQTVEEKNPSNCLLNFWVAVGLYTNGTIGHLVTSNRTHTTNRLERSTKHKATNIATSLEVYHHFFKDKNHQTQC